MMTFERRIFHHGSSPTGVPRQLSLTSLRKCWFDLHRQGGCGAGELALSETFELRDAVEIGDWISIEGAPGDRWYLGQVESRQADLPAGLSLQLQGMSSELNQIFPGGFGSDADGVRPQLFAATDLFSQDPDEGLQTLDWVTSVDELVRLLMTQFLPAGSHIQYLPELVETPQLPALVQSLKMRGEESVRSLLKDLGLRAQSASWGVDEQGRFFFLQPRSTLLASFQDQVNLTRLTETRDLESIYNRLLLTGDYVYDRLQATDDRARRAYRWRANFVEPQSSAQYGERRIRIWLPWIRTQADGLAFAREFFRTYAQPASRFLLETTAQSTLPRPWLGTLQALDRDGQPLMTARVETIRVLFEHVPRLRMVLGPEDPHVLWPEPAHDERWEVPNQVEPAGGAVSVPPLPGDDDPGNPGPGDEDSSGSPGSTLPGSSAGSEGSSGSESQSEMSSASDGSSEDDRSSNELNWGSSASSGSEDPSEGSSAESSEEHSASDASSASSGQSSESSDDSSSDDSSSDDSSSDDSSSDDSSSDDSSSDDSSSDDSSSDDSSSDDSSSDDSSSDDSSSDDSSSDDSSSDDSSSDDSSSGDSSSGDSSSGDSSSNDDTTFAWEH